MKFWTQAPPGRVTRLVEVSPAALAMALEPLPPTAPPPVSWAPGVNVSTTHAVAAVLDELEAVAMRLFPAWLTAAGGIDSSNGVRPAAVRSLALRQAARTAQFGPFLADLAQRAVSDDGPGAGGFGAEVRAAGLARVIGDSYQRSHAALVVDVPEGLSGPDQQGLLTGCEWLAHHGGFAVWLTGSAMQPGEVFDRTATVAVRLPDHVARLVGSTAPTSPPASPGAGHMRYPALSGQPHPASATEQALEAALATRPWAFGRSWNRAYQPHELDSPIRVDLMWEQERCVVELDGPEHCGPLQFEADRRRDVLLQLAGFAVLRFTNGQVRDDLAAVLWQLEHFLTARRDGKDRQ